jgi:hypothetical protein
MRAFDALRLPPAGDFAVEHVRFAAATRRPRNLMSATVWRPRVVSAVQEDLK